MSHPAAALFVLYGTAICWSNLKPVSYLYTPGVVVLTVL